MVVPRVIGPLLMPNRPRQFWRAPSAEGTGAADADNAGGNLLDMVKLKEIRDESSWGPVQVRRFALDEWFFLASSQEMRQEVIS
jgi:hypothetical protein